MFSKQFKQYFFPFISAAILCIPAFQVTAAYTPHTINSPSMTIPIDGAAAAPSEINHQYSSPYFTFPDFYNMQSNEHLTILKNYHTYQQTTEYSCGPAAALTVLNHFKETSYTEAALAKLMKTQPYPIGSNTADMSDFFRQINWKVDTSLQHEPFNDFADFKAFVQKNLQQNIPILVESVEWGGHWRVIIGYDTMNTDSSLDDTLILADPYDTCDHLQDGYTVQNAEKFFAMWFDHSMLPEKQRIQPWITAQPK